MEHEQSIALESEVRHYHPLEPRGGLNIAPWVWVLIFTLIMQLFGIFFITGRVMEKLDSVSYRVERLETQVDRFNQKQP